MDELAVLASFFIRILSVIFVADALLGTVYRWIPQLIKRPIYDWLHKKNITLFIRDLYIISISIGIAFVYKREMPTSMVIYEGIAFGIVSARYYHFVMKDITNRIDSFLDKIGKN